MLEREKKPTELLMATDGLRDLLLRNPGLPLFVFAGEDCNSGDYTYTSCSWCYARKGEFLDCMQEVNEECCYTDRIDFREALEEKYEDFPGNDTEFNKFIEQKLHEYDPYWRECIILYVNN